MGIKVKHVAYKFQWVFFFSFIIFIINSRFIIYVFFLDLIKKIDGCLYLDTEFKPIYNAHFGNEKKHVIKTRIKWSFSRK